MSNGSDEYEKLVTEGIDRDLETIKRMRDIILGLLTACKSMRSWLHVVVGGNHEAFEKDINPIIKKAEKEIEMTDKDQEARAI